MSALNYFKLEATYGGQWLDLSDGAFTPHSEMLTASAKQWRRITATHPNLDGDYLVHATLGMVSEQVKIWCRGVDQVDLAGLYTTLEAVFEQFEFRIRITFDDFRETWLCQASDYSIERSHVWTHNAMAVFTATVPRFPDVTREELF